MQPPEPISTIELFPEERAHLLNLLTGLRDAQWQAPTRCLGWSVKDVALHLLGDDLGLLSRMRDGFSQPSPGEEEGLVAFVNQLNEQWVLGTRRLSPRVLCDLLQFSGDQMCSYFASLDLMALGGPVSWAGPGPAPVWLDVAREYTERWHHQQHIREALEMPGLTERRFLSPVLATFIHALPHTFRDVDVPQGATVQVYIIGEAGGDWAVQREADRWALYTGAPAQPNARVTMDQADAWRLFTKGLPHSEAARRIRIEGDRRLGLQVLEAVAIIA